MTDNLRTDAEVADVFYDPAKTYGGSLQEGINRLRDRTGMGEEDANNHLNEASQFFSDARISPPEAGVLHDLLVSHLHKPVSEEMVQEWAVESRRQLREVYGSSVDERMTRVREYVTQHPNLAKQLAQTGLGVHPRVVMALSERASQLRIKEK